MYLFPVLHTAVVLTTAPLGSNGATQSDLAPDKANIFRNISRDFFKVSALHTHKPDDQLCGQFHDEIGKEALENVDHVNLLKKIVLCDG